MREEMTMTIQTKLTDALGDVEDLAMAKGLDQTFAVELLALRQSVERAVALDDRDRADRALREARVLWGVLRGTPGRYGGLSVPA
jgi:hypothetical protein